MSKFVTKIQVKVQAVLALLPPKAFIHSTEFDSANGTVNIIWEHDQFFNGRTFPTDFPVLMLKERTLPEGVRDMKQPLPAPQPVKVVPPPAPEPAQAVPIVFLLRTAEEFDKARADGKPMEFQGIEPIWKPVGKIHQFSAGNYYRLTA